MQIKDILSQVSNGEMDKGLAFQIMLTGSLERSSFVVEAPELNEELKIEMCHINFMDWIVIKTFIDNYDSNHNNFNVEPLMSAQEFVGFEIPIHYKKIADNLNGAVIGNHLTINDMHKNKFDFYFYYIEDLDKFTVIHGKDLLNCF